MSRKQSWGLITLMLLLAAALRLGALGQVPPGLAHDEVANWLIAEDILRGEHAIYFTAAYGHEPLYQYIQAATVALFGDHWLGLRWPSAALGLLGIAATHTLIRRLFGFRVALLTSAGLVVGFWPVFYARVALRAISLPFLAALAAYFLLRALAPWLLQPQTGARRTITNRGYKDAVLAGCFLGLSLYTYMAARILPFIVIVWFLYSILVSSFARTSSDRPLLPWPHIVAYLLTAAIVAAPLAIWLVSHPNAEYRITEIRQPLDQLLAGNPVPTAQNFIANLKSFTISGDALPRQNIPGRPVFADPISAVLFYVGILIALWRWRDPRYGFLLIWLIGALGPSVATADAPSSIRNILGLVVVFIFPALALAEASQWLQQRISERHNRRSLLPALCLLLTPCLFLTARDYFVRWPKNETARFVYQADLTAVGQKLDTLPSETAVAVAGLSVHSLDAPSLKLATRSDTGDVRLCDTRETLVIPAGGNGRLFVPQFVPVDEDFEQLLTTWGARKESQAAFTSYRLPHEAAMQQHLGKLKTKATLPTGVPSDAPVTFEGRLTFLGYKWLEMRLDDPLTLLTYWRVEKPPSFPVKIFVHLTDESGDLIDQSDGLGSPAQGWRPDDLIIQKHTLSWPQEHPDLLYMLHVGLYNPSSKQRLSARNADRVLIEPPGE